MREQFAIVGGGAEGRHRPRKSFLTLIILAQGGSL